ncbi:MAG: hypothetical protein ACRDWT_11415 [Jatrophihabitantaceae bacterium]
MSTVPAETLEAVRDVLAAHADELGVDRASLTAIASHAVIARRRDGELVRLDVSTYAPSELSL